MDDETSATERVAAAYRRTVAAGVARVEVFFDSTWAPSPRARARQGGLLGPAISLHSGVSRSLRGHFSRKFGHVRAEGVMDLQRRGYMLDHGGFARMGADGKEWAGQPGRAISTRSAEEPNSPTPLWLIDVLAGLTEATMASTDVVRGTPCTHHHVTVALSQASPVIRDAVAVPGVDRFEDVLASPIEVWIELWDVGSPLEGFDWTRLQAFPTTLAS